MVFGFRCRGPWKPSSLFLLVELLLLCIASDAFSGSGNKNIHELPSKRRFRLVKELLYPGCLAPALMLAFWQPLEPAVALNEFQTLRSPLSSKASSASTYKLSDDKAFKRLTQPQLPRAVKELKALQELQDSRLDACEEKGKFWEHCFMYGQNDGLDVIDARDGEDKILSLSPTPGTKKIPTW